MGKEIKLHGRMPMLSFVRYFNIILEEPRFIKFPVVILFTIGW